MMMCRPSQRFLLLCGVAPLLLLSVVVVVVDADKTRVSRGLSGKKKRNKQSWNGMGKSRAKGIGKSSSSSSSEAAYGYGPQPTIGGFPASTPNPPPAIAPIAPTVPSVPAPVSYTLPDLPYPYEALEPYIDTTTMKIHHDKHHAAYVKNINKALEGKPKVPIVDLMAKAIQAGPAIRNNGGGHYNHAFFWSEMAPPDQAKNTKPSAQLEELINKSFGSLDELKAKFEERAAPGALFGSGWVWICVTQDGTELKLVGTPNQDNPLMEGALEEGILFPILGLDVWEHAYYLKYQNLRADYITNWWNVVNWDKVSENTAYVVANHVGVSF